MSKSQTSSSIPSAINRRAALAGLMVMPLTACETLDPAILEGVLGSGGLTQADAALGIREALGNGVLSALGIVGKSGGFLDDQIIHIPLPRSLQSVQSVMSSIGAGGLLNNLEVQLNRGAEAAAPVAKDIFLGAIRDLTIQDAIGIVKGADNAATLYLQDKTTDSLTNLFSPIMENALDQTGALQLFDQVAASMRNVPLAPQLGADAKRDLIGHGVEYALGGVFHYVAVEEKAIRENPAKRTSEILRRVFGSGVI